MQTESESKAIVAEIYCQEMQNRHRYQAMYDTLSDQARRAIGVAYTKNTRQAYVQAWGQVLRSRRPQPVDASDARNDHELLSAAGRRGEVGRNIPTAAAAISTAHRAADVDNPCVSPIVKMALKGISHQHGQPQVQASALDAIRSTAMLPRTGRRGVPEARDHAVMRG